jgi:hypothetical protein
VLDIRAIEKEIAVMLIMAAILTLIGTMWYRKRSRASLAKPG